MTYIEAIIIAIIEGLSEFLPVSSTGHIIVASSVLGIQHESFTKLFTVVIQLGAILSVVVLYWKRFFQSFDFYLKIGLAFVPAVIAGLFLKDFVDSLLERVDVVGYSLLLGGIFLLFVDKIFSDEKTTEREITYPKAFKIGLFQVIAMIPGVSRSAATIIGGLTQKLNRKTAAEFSFFLAVPTMFAATVLSIFKFYKSGESLSSIQINLLIAGNVVAFLVAMIAIKSFINFLTKNGFKVFGYYRIVLGIIVLVLYYVGSGLSIM
jgi:undecaprenyl-diphosphatase